MKLSRVNFPLLIILAGIFFSLYLLWQIPDEIHFSGDGGIKALLAKQLSSGKLRFDLDLPVPLWVKNLWHNGLYPFEPPFAYQISNRYYITFPFTFPLVTAPFHTILGFRGLYIIPLISTWIIWVIFYKICHFFQINKVMTSLALVTLIFASPLSMYSAMYWEHTLAVCLAFSGLATVLIKGEESFSIKYAVCSGILIGLSVWFRPEFLALVAILFLIIVSSYLINIDILNIVNRHKIIFLLAIALTVLGFFIANKLIYNHPLGAHSLQVVEGFSPRVRLLNAQKYFMQMSDSLLYHFPIVYWIISFVALSVFSNTIKLTNKMRQLLLISVLFICIVPILLPSDGGKQWGPRFLLLLVPLLNLLAILALNFTLSIKKFGFKYISSAIFAALFVIGFHINIYLGTTYSYLENNAEAFDVLDFLRKDSNQVVAVAHQYVSQTFESVFNEKIFFLTKESDDVSQLIQAINQQGYEKFIYICPVYDSCFSKPKIPDVLEINTAQEPLRMQLKTIKKGERFIIQEAAIAKAEG